MFMVLALFLLGFGLPESSKKTSETGTCNVEYDDTIKINQLIALGYLKIDGKEADSAISTAQEAYRLSAKNTYAHGLAHSQFIIAKAYNQKKAYPQALSYYLKSLAAFEKIKNQLIVSDINYEIGMMYSNWEVYEKAVEHFRISNHLNKKGNDEVIYMMGLQAIAFTFTKLNQADSAISYYSKVLDYYNSENKLYPAINILEIIADINKNSGRHHQSIENQLVILSHYQKLGNTDGEFATLNNLGFSHKYLNNYEKSLEYFKKAMKLSGNKHFNASILLNIGVIYHNTGNYESSLEYIFKALKIRQTEKNLQETAKINNLLATTYFHIQDFETAINYAKMAIGIGEQIEDQDILYQSYLIVSKIYQAGGNFEIALDYHQKYSDIKAGLRKTDQQKQTEILSKKYFIDKTEKELKLLMAEEEVKDLTLRQLRLEKEKKEKELTMLKENEVLLEKQYKLEKATSMQRLQLVNQKLEAEKKDREISELNKDKEIKEYVLRQKEIEKKEQEKEIELLESNNNLLESDKQLKELQSNREKVYRNILITAFFVTVFILFLILFYYLKKKKTNKILSMQNAEINKQKTDIEKQAKKLQILNENLIKLDNFKESLTGMIVHDLKNPLNTLLNVSDNKRVQQSAKQMLLMVMNILDVHKFEDAAMKLNLNSAQLYNNAEGAVEQVIVPAKEKNIKIKNKIPLTYAVEMDTEITERVFVNLLTNAIKYTPANGSIVLNVKPYQSDFIRIEVSDNGQGIPENKKHLVFDKFGQVEAKKMGQIRSTGLGLTFCKLAIEAHGGNIGVESVEGEGATFWFTMHRSGDILPETPETSNLQEENKNVMSANSYHTLKPFIDELQKHKYYQITKLREIIAQIDDSLDDEIKIWKENLQKAINSSNKVLYQELTNLNENGE